MKLAKYLKKHGLTYKEFAEKVGVTQPQISRIINKKLNPSTHLVKKIEEVTKGEVTFNDLFSPELPSRLNKKRKKVRVK